MALFYSRTRKTAGFWAHGRGFSRRLIACCALVAGKRKSRRISRFSLFLCFDKIAFINSSDVPKDAKISDKVLCYTFIKLLEQSRILSNWRKQALNDQESHRPQGVDMDHFGYPWSRSTRRGNQLTMIICVCGITLYREKLIARSLCREDYE
ncbi:hypothetical protein T08_5330 [Trichinella sp. T8]|nr:hypothetical protein T08_5330 [Trichinella sp. T8]